MNFAHNLKQLRESRHMTQAQLAEHLNVSRPTIAGYEAQNRQPDYEKLEKISTLFQVPISYLLTGKETETMPNNQKNLWSEKFLNQEVLRAYKELSVSSKKELLEYIELLQLRDKENRKKEAK